MHLLFRRQLAELYLKVIRLSWTVILVPAGLLFATTWAVMAYFEGPESEIASGPIYWWYFLVTSTSTGYGDFFPKTLGGRIAGAFVMIVGIALVGAVLAKITGTVFQLHQRRIQGKMSFEHFVGHTIILGYRRGQTEKLIAEFRLDPGFRDTLIILCADGLAENPMPDAENLEFVAGDLADLNTLRRAGAAGAERVIVFCEDDAHTLAAALAAEHAVPEKAHVVVQIDHQFHIETIQKTRSGIGCVPSLTIALIVQEAQEPGSAAVFEELACNGGTANAYRADLPPGFPSQPYLDLLVDLKLRCDLTLIGVAASHNSSEKPNLNPPAGLAVAGGMSVFYIAKERCASI